MSIAWKVKDLWTAQWFASFCGKEDDKEQIFSCWWNFSIYWAIQLPRNDERQDMIHNSCSLSSTCTKSRHHRPLAYVAGIHLLSRTFLRISVLGQINPWDNSIVFCLRKYQLLWMEGWSHDESKWMTWESWLGPWIDFSSAVAFSNDLDKLTQMPVASISTYIKWS